MGSASLYGWDLCDSILQLRPKRSTLPRHNGDQDTRDHHLLYEHSYCILLRRDHLSLGNYTAKNYRPTLESNNAGLLAASICRKCGVFGPGLVY